MSDRIVCILGTAPSSRHMANELPLEVEVWALNDCWTFLQRPWDRWFEIHGESMWRADGPQHEEFLRTGKSPVQEQCVAREGSRVYMLREYDGFPLSEAYPFDRIVERFGRANNEDHPYLTSTIDYMIALAIAESVDEIRVYGINHATTTEYTHQRPACEYWLGVAQEHGIRVIIPKDCPLLQGPLYGPKKRGVLHRERLQTRLSRLEYELQEIGLVREQIQGATATLDHMEEQFAMVETPEEGKGVKLPDAFREVLARSRRDIIEKREAVNNQLQATHGALQLARQLIGFTEEPEMESTEAVNPKAPIVSANGHSVLEAKTLVLPG